MWSLRPRSGPRPPGSLLLAAVLVATASLCACPGGEVRPVEITLDEDACSLCRMAVSQRQFAAELVTSSGRAEVFDDIGCLARWLERNRRPDRSAAFVVEYQSGTWLRAEDAAYLESPKLPTPMGSGLAAFADRARAAAATRDLGGEVIDWDQVTRKGPPS